MCHAQIRADNFFSKVCQMLKIDGVFRAEIGQCMQGLALPKDIIYINKRFEKPGAIITNIINFIQLHRQCDHRHVHVHAVGHTKVGEY